MEALDTIADIALVIGLVSLFAISLPVLAKGAGGSEPAPKNRATWRILGTVSFSVYVVAKLIILVMR